MISSLRSGETCPNVNDGTGLFLFGFDVDLVRVLLDEERVVLFTGRAIVWRVDPVFFVLLVDLDREFELVFATYFFLTSICIIRTKVQSNFIVSENIADLN